MLVSLTFTTLGAAIDSTSHQLPSSRNATAWTPSRSRSSRPAGISLQKCPNSGGLGERMGELTGTVTEAMAKRAGRDPGDLAVRVSMGALIGGNMAAAFAALEEGGDVLEYVVDRGVSQLETGLDL